MLCIVVLIQAIANNFLPHLVLHHKSQQERAPYLKKH